MTIVDHHRISTLQRDDGTLELPSKLKGRAAQKVIGKLLTDGLVEEICAGGSMPDWRKDDDRAIALRITAVGLAAIPIGDAGAGKPKTKASPARRGRGDKKKGDARPKQIAKSQTPRRKPQGAGPSKQDRVIALLREARARPLRPSCRPRTGRRIRYVGSLPAWCARSSA